MIYNSSLISNGSHIIVECIAKGSPLPDITYYSSQTVISVSGTYAGHYIEMTDGIKVLAVSKTNLNHTYSCVAKNKYGLQRKEFSSKYLMFTYFCSKIFLLYSNENTCQKNCVEKV